MTKEVFFKNALTPFNITRGLATKQQKSDCFEKYNSAARLNEDPEFDEEDFLSEKCFELWHKAKLIGLCNFSAKIHLDRPHTTLNITQQLNNVFILKNYRHTGLGQFMAQSIGRCLNRSLVFLRPKVNSESIKKINIRYKAICVTKKGSRFNQDLSNTLEPPWLVGLLAKENISITREQD